jgi:hypothetical protein
MGEALRREGLDEHAVAGNWVHVVEQLKKGNAEAAGVEKLLVDVLKECSRQLEAESEHSLDAGGGPVIVQLVHKVDRPARLDTPPAPDPARQANAS